MWPRVPAGKTTPDELAVDVVIHGAAWGWNLVGLQVPWQIVLDEAGHVVWHQVTIVCMRVHKPP